MEKDGVKCKPWKYARSPRKILAIRLQALGDTVITLPYLLDLKQKHPLLEIHFLTRKEVSAIPAYIELFERVIAIGGARNTKLQFLLMLFKLPFLWRQRYDAVIDLQNNVLSAMVRKLLMPKAWSAFDKYSDHSAGERIRITIEALQLWSVKLSTNFETKVEVDSLLSTNGRRKDCQMVVLNPAGSFPSRHWPLDYYIDFAKHWLDQISPNTQFVLLLLPSVKDKADYISNALGNACINLTGKANQVQAFAIIKKCCFVLSEDSGLMHMAWVQRVPTLAMFSSSKKVWSAPQGNWSLCLDSSDMECGPCQLSICKFGDNRCLTRYQPEFVLSKAQSLLNYSNAES